MKKFKGNRNLDEIIREAEEKGFEVDITDFQKGGDWIWLRDTKERMIQVLYNTFNGRFNVYTPESGNEPWATERSEELDGDPDYDEMLSLFYIP